MDLDDTIDAVTHPRSRSLDYHYRYSWEPHPLPSTHYDNVARASQERPSTLIERHCAHRLYEYHRSEDDEKRYSSEVGTRHPIVTDLPIIESGTPRSSRWKGRDYDADLVAWHPRPRSDSLQDRSTPVSTGLLKRPITANTSRKEEGAGGKEMAQRTKKRVRYLHESDRHTIIKRIENGEKQATLAREFGVTRAAICHINKNRSEILSRGHAHANSTEEESNGTEPSVTPLRADAMVHQVRSTSVLLLLTMLRDHRSSGATFRRVAGRLIMILLEETLAEVTTAGAQANRGLPLNFPICGVALGADGSPFLFLFHQMEPRAPQGLIHLSADPTAHGPPVYQLDHMDLPANITQHQVLLFSSSCSSGNAECTAIEALCGVGCTEESITLVVLLVATDGMGNITKRFPQVKIITGGIDRSGTLQPERMGNGFGDFVSRYNSS